MRARKADPIDRIETPLGSLKVKCNERSRSMKMSNLHVTLRVGACLALVAGFAIACRGLPDNFDHMTLDQKVAAYQRYGPGARRSLIHAREEIAKHGVPAATAMIPFLTQEKTGISPIEAATIIWEVQLRGCSLSGTPAHSALRSLFARMDDSLDRSTVETILESIERDRHDPVGPASLSKADCQS